NATLMYVDLCALSSKFNGNEFYVQWENEEKHYRITFVGRNAGRQMLITKNQDGNWYDLEDRNHNLAQQLGTFIEANLISSKTISFQ
ncbi:MAG TPA: hypothetical protein VFV08_02085, partial [Puia sp.]|nr:hypothetical protein [Puia sp.]